MKEKWFNFDNLTIKPWLLHNWPQEKRDHDAVTQKIKKLFDERYNIKSYFSSGEETYQEQDNNYIKFNYDDEIKK